MMYWSLDKNQQLRNFRENFTRKKIRNWLVVWNIFHFSIDWECHHPKWLSYYSRGVAQPPNRWFAFFPPRRWSPLQDTTPQRTCSVMALKLHPKAPEDPEADGFFTGKIPPRFKMLVNQWSTLMLESCEHCFFHQTMGVKLGWMMVLWCSSPINWDPMNWGAGRSAKCPRSWAAPAPTTGTARAACAARAKPRARARGGACCGTSQRAAAMDAAAQKKSPLGCSRTGNGSGGAPVSEWDDWDDWDM